jgi:hypothetical protein
MFEFHSALVNPVPVATRGGRFVDEWPLMMQIAGNQALTTASGDVDPRNAREKRSQHRRWDDD